MGERQHDPDRDRIFVRALEGKYSLKVEASTGVSQTQTVRIQERGIFGN